MDKYFVTASVRNNKLTADATFLSEGESEHTEPFRIEFLDSDGNIIIKGKMCFPTIQDALKAAKEEGMKYLASVVSRKEQPFEDIFGLDDEPMAIEELTGLSLPRTMVLDVPSDRQEIFHAALALLPEDLSFVEQIAWLYRQCRDRGVYTAQFAEMIKESKIVPDNFVFLFGDGLFQITSELDPDSSDQTVTISNFELHMWEPLAQAVKFIGFDIIEPSTHFTIRFVTHKQYRLLELKERILLYFHNSNAHGART